MEDRKGTLGSLKALIAQQERVDMSSVKIGDIIYVALNEDDGLVLKDGYESRNKYIVIVGFTLDGKAVGALLINTRIDRAKRSQELMDCQYPLLVRHYQGVLEYDSWLDCSDIFEIENDKISRRKGLLKGALTADDRERVMEFLRNTEVFDKATKRKFGIIATKPKSKPL